MYYPMNQQPMMPYNGAPQYGMGMPQMPKAKYTQPLTPEIISKLRSSGDSMKIEVSQEDLWRAACTHKENGVTTLVTDGTNPDTGNPIVHCTICGESFEMVDAKKEEVEKAVALIINLLQTSKTMYLDAPENLVKQYYQMLPLLKMFPKLYERSQKNFDMYANAYGYSPNPTAAGTNGFAMMGSMLQNPYGAYQQPMAQPMYQPQMMQQPMAQPYMQQPMYQPQMMQQPMPGVNPFMYGNPAPAPAPAPAAGAVPAVAPDQAATTGEVSQQKTFNV